MAGDRRVDQPGIFREIAECHRAIVLLHRARLELLAQRGVCAVVLGDQDQPRRVLVQTVHNARPHLTADAGEIMHMIQERIDQRPVLVAGCRMHHHAARLVDDHHVRILIQNIQRDVLRDDVHRARLRHRQRDVLPGCHLEGGLDLHLAVDGDGAFKHQG